MVRVRVNHSHNQIFRLCPDLTNLALGYVFQAIFLLFSFILCLANVFQVLPVYYCSISNPTIFVLVDFLDLSWSVALFLCLCIHYNNCVSSNSKICVMWVL